MKLQISEYAASRLDEIWDYYAEEANKRVADRITKKILADMDWLLEHPRDRRKVSGNYKIIYRIIDDLIIVSDIFDTRQDPEKMAW